MCLQAEDSNIPLRYSGILNIQQLYPKQEEEEEGVSKSNNNFLGKHCEYCTKCGETYCWYNSSDWEEGLLDVEKSNTANPSVQKTPFPTVRRPPAGWAEQRHREFCSKRE